MITMFRVAKEEKQTENRLNQDFSQDENDIKKRKQQQEPQLDKDTAQQM